MNFEEFADKCAPALALISSAYLVIRIGIALIFA
jgi:hypothetical protein